MRTRKSSLRRPKLPCKSFSHRELCDQHRGNTGTPPCSPRSTTVWKRNPRGGRQNPEYRQQKARRPSQVRQPQMVTAHAWEHCRRINGAVEFGRAGTLALRCGLQPAYGGEDALQEGVRVRGATGDIDIHGDDLVHAAQTGVVLAEDAAATDRKSTRLNSS